MVWQEQIETLVCLLSDADLRPDSSSSSSDEKKKAAASGSSSQKCIYWPDQRKDPPLRIGNNHLEVTLQSDKRDSGGAPWGGGTERIFTVMNLKENTSRLVGLA